MSWWIKKLERAVASKQYVVCLISAGIGAFYGKLVTYDFDIDHETPTRRDMKDIMDDMFMNRRFKYYQYPNNNYDMQLNACLNINTLLNMNYIIELSMANGNFKINVYNEDTDIDIVHHGEHFIPMINNLYKTMCVNGLI